MVVSKNYVAIGGTVFYYERIDKLPHTKENAFAIGIATFCRSWTFDRMTHREKIRCLEAFDFANEQGTISGTFKSRMQAMNAVYNAYLMGLGYNGHTWRDNAH